MRKLVVIDTAKKQVHCYTVGNYLQVDDNYISGLGFNLNDCSWACGELDFFYHKGKLL